MQAAIVREPVLDLHPQNGPGLAPFRTLTQFMQVIYLSDDQVRESTHLSVTALQTLLSKIDGLHDSLDRERTEARDKEQRMYSKITELEKVLTALPKIEALTHTLEKEREEARDREQRLSNKIRELEKTIANLNTSVGESLKTCNTKLDKLSLRQLRPQTPEKRPANGMVAGKAHKPCKRTPVGAEEHMHRT